MRGHTARAAEPAGTAEASTAAVGAQVGAAASGAGVSTPEPPSWKVFGLVLVLAMAPGRTKEEGGRRTGEVAISAGGQFVDSASAVAGPVGGAWVRFHSSRPRICFGLSSKGGIRWMLPRMLGPGQAPLQIASTNSAASSRGCSPPRS